MTEYALAIAASEIGCGTRDIERMCNGQVYRNDDGLRVINGDTLRQLIAERDAKLTARREAEAAKRASTGENPVRQRVRAIAESQRGEDLDAGAVAIMLRHESEERQARLDEQRDDYRRQERQG